MTRRRCCKSCRCTLQPVTCVAETLFAQLGEITGTPGIGRESMTWASYYAAVTILGFCTDCLGELEVRIAGFMLLAKGAR